MSYSFRSIVDGGADSEMIYYNVLMTSTQTADLTVSQPPQPVKFNETRDAPIIKDASQYNFSIIRFSMNGPGRELPLFIPVIQTNGTVSSQQQDPNQTIYSLAIAYQREWNYTDPDGNAETVLVTITPASNPIRYIPEIQNSVLAPVPVVPATGIVKQDLSTRYYWVYTYSHFCQLVNNTLQSAMFDIWSAFNVFWTALPKLPGQDTPYPTFQDFLLAHDTPFIKYNEETKLFEIYGDTRAFNMNGALTGNNDSRTGLPVGTQASVPAFVAPTYSASDPPSGATQPYLRLFFNSELNNLLANFNSVFYGAVGGSSIPFPLSLSPVQIGVQSVGAAVGPWLYSYEILFQNNLYSNIYNINPLLQGSSSVPPPVYNPYFLIPTDRQNLYWKIVQDYGSTGALWSPISAIVFTSAMLPIKKEYTTANVNLNNGNLGSGSSGSQSAFQPIITDFVIDQQYERAEGWRDFTLYEPSAEYKMISMAASHEEIRNIDMQVFWKYRLTGELIPLTAANCSDINIKMLFRKSDYRS
jgi:hypothetical protein